MARYISAGIDVGTRTIRVAIAEAEKGKSEFRVLGLGVAPSYGLRHGYIVNHEEAVQSIRRAVKKAEKAAGMRIKRALVSIGGISLESHTTNASLIISRIDGQITEDDVERVLNNGAETLNLTNQKIIHRFPFSYKIDGKEVFGKPVNMRGMKLEAKSSYISILDQHLDDLISALEASGIEVEDVIAAPLAASLVTLTKQQRVAGCVLVNIGAETVSVAVFENDQPVSLRVFPIGSTDITNDIALGLRISLEEAEKIKLGNSGDTGIPKKKLDDIIEARLKDIFELISGHLKKLGRNELLPAGIVMTGGGAGITTIEDLARASLKLPARIAIPDGLAHKDVPHSDPSWSVTYGLCLLGFSDSYTSDLLQLGNIRIKQHAETVLAWLKQFRP